MTAPSVLEVLERATTTLQRKDGWTRDNYISTRSKIRTSESGEEYRPMCALGHLRAAVGLMDQVTGDRPMPPDGTHDDYLMTNALRDAQELVAGCIGPADRFQSREQVIYRFNDRQPRTQAGRRAVLEAFQCALEKAREATR